LGVGASTLPVVSEDVEGNPKALCCLRIKS
jgi:hypothetical protein